MKTLLTTIIIILSTTFVFAAEKKENKCVNSSLFNLKCNIIGKSFSKLKNFSEKNQTINDTVNNIRKK
tara:strand:- start:105 stop:308 length:204 start_codon:yes stop_codon:yes gene_type:complete